MFVALIKDLDGGTTDGVIISTHSTWEEIQECIDEMKEAKPGEWQWDDLVGCLPEDCRVFTAWDDLEVVYY